MGWQVGVVVALASAFVAQLGALWRQRGAEAAPDVDLRRPLRSVAGLFRSKWWTIGYVAAAVAWVLHVGALAVAPLSIVQACLAAGFVFLAVLAERYFGFELRKREWAGIALAAGGLTFLALTAGDVKGSQSSYELAAILAFEAVLVGIGAFLLATARSGRGGDRTGILLGAGAGVLFTVTHIAIKALTKDFDGLLSLVSVWTLVVVAGGVIAFFASARSLQIGPAVPVIAITSITGNATSIAAGVVVFGDPLGEGPMAAARIAAFLVVVIVAGLLPGPIHEAGERKQRVSRAGGRAGAPAEA